MFWKEVAAPAIPVTLLSEAKAQARVTSSSEDALVSLYIEAALRRIEADTGRAVIARQFKGYLDEFPDCDEIEIPLGGLSAVDSVKYTDDAGLQTWASSNYTVDATRPYGRIMKGLGVVWPTVKLSIVNAVEITFTAGYGTAETAIPGPLRLAILFLTAHWYDQRAPVNIGNIVNEIPQTLQYVLDAYRIPTV